MKKLSLLLTGFVFTASLAYSQSGIFKAGDKVEAWNVAWYKATVLTVGTEDHKGYYLIRYDDFSSASGQWLKASSIRSIKSEKESSASEPRTGKYHVLSYINIYNPVRLGHFLLEEAGKYKFYDNGDNFIGAGTYSYDNGTKAIAWHSGPFRKYNWDGKFTVSREGKTHSITLKRGTVGSNSTDSK
jgi:hypothetical protein